MSAAFDRFAPDSQDFDDYARLSRDDDDDALVLVDTLFSAQCRARAEALRRIETMARAFVEETLRGADARAAALAGAAGASVSTRAAGNEWWAVARDEGDDVDGESDDDMHDDTEMPSFRRQGVSFERFWDVAAALAMALRRSNCESSMTLRELYYVMNSRGRAYKTTEDQLKRALRNLSRALGTPRCALGVSASSKGQIAGRCHIETACGQRIDCTATDQGGWPITGDLFELDAMKIFSDAAYVIIVEKDAVFNRLCTECVFETLPCVLATAKGFPDIATRKFLHLLRCALNGKAQFFGLVDWNPHGAWILSTYVNGCAASDMDAREFKLPDLTWIGLRSDDLHMVPEDALQELTPRDAGMIRNALEGNDSHPLRMFNVELDEMRKLGKKADIEALYAARGDEHFSLTDYVSWKIAACEE